MAALAIDGVSAFALGGIGRGFADRSHLGLPALDYVVCAEVPGMVQTDLGMPLQVVHGLDRLTEADLVVVLPTETVIPRLSPKVAAALHAAHQREAIIVTFCTGSYVLADAGLLDGRRATTHWSLTDDFAARFPKVSVAPQALYIDEGSLITGAGGAAGIDLCLHLLRREHGATVANAIAREMVASSLREGDHAQYPDRPVPDIGEEPVTTVIDWLHANLDKATSINDLAARALMSERTFARRFKAATGTTPYSWLLTQRLHRAAELLETTDLPIEEIAHRVGYNTVSTFRDQFIKRHGIPPRNYRQKFSGNVPRAAMGTQAESRPDPPLRYPSRHDVAVTRCA
ncbi:GlxA family transcriptional regulator [Nonomuraea sp. KM90]|uniref:GlxA family transcriptional regulator n=1 Tax=Nonomuraea sp. KM90 TaxID=3457428 RepID=UPI003FCD89BE